jgi:hypothetical protein
MHARRLTAGGPAWTADGGASLWAAPSPWRESPLDAARLAACERNVPLYERHGFEVTKEHRLPGGPSMWLMWRPPSS